MAKRTYTYDGSEWVGLTSTTADLSNYANLTNTPISGFRNAIINGGFDVWQRGAGGSGPGYSADRWRNNNVTPWSQSTDVPESSFRYSIKGTGSSSQPLFRYHFETADAIKLAGKTQILSLWIKATSGVPVIFGIHTSTTVDNPATGSWTEPLGQVTYTASGAWERKTLVVSVPSNVKSIRVQVGANANITGDLFFTGVQLEAGSIATPFEQRPIGTELALCQRYYERASGVAASPFQMFTQGGWDSATTFSATWIYTTPKRVSPSVFSTTGITCLHHGIAWLNVSSVASYTEMSLYGVRINYAVTGSATRGESGVAVFNSATAYVEASAEL